MGRISIRVNNVLDIVKASPGCTTKDVCRTIGAEGDPIQCEKVRKLLVRLVHQGYVVDSTTDARRTWYVVDGPLRPKGMKGRERRLSVTYKGRTELLTDWCRELGMDYHVVKHRLSKGWSVEDAFELPVGSKRCRT